MNPVEKYIVLCNYYERLYKNRVGHYVTSVVGHNHNTQFDIRYMQTIKLYKPFFALLALNENFCKVSGMINKYSCYTLKPYFLRASVTAGGPPSTVQMSRPFVEARHPGQCGDLPRSRSGQYLHISTV